MELVWSGLTPPLPEDYSETYGHGNEEWRSGVEGRYKNYALTLRRVESVAHEYAAEDLGVQLVDTKSILNVCKDGEHIVSVGGVKLGAIVILAGSYEERDHTLDEVDSPR